MRKIAEKKKDNGKKGSLIVGGVLVVLMILSTLGYSFITRDDSTGNNLVEKYNGREFVMTGNFWKFNVGEEDFYLTYLPQNVSDVKVDGEFNFGDYSQKPLYFVNYNAASVEILQNLGQFVLRYQEACLGECEEELELPAKDCSENLIIFVDGGEDKVWKNESCVYISGDFIKSSDAFMYKLLGI